MHKDCKLETNAMDIHIIKIGGLFGDLKKNTFFVQKKDLITKQEIPAENLSYLFSY